MKNSSQLSSSLHQLRIFLDKLTHFVTRHFFALSIGSLFLGIIMSGVFFWRLQINKQEPITQPSFLLDQEKYIRVTEVLNSTELSRQKIDPRNYYDLFIN